MNLNRNQQRAVKFLQEHRGSSFDFKQLKKELRLRNNDWLQLLPLIKGGLIEREKRGNGGRNRYFYWCT